MTSNWTINYFLQYENYFLGCFHINNLPPYPHQLPASMIIFSEYHWSSLVLQDEKNCLYFDSFGLGIEDGNLTDYLKPYYNKIIYSRLKIQHDKSISCGLFSILFIQLVHSKQDYKCFLSLFSKKSLIINDKIVYKLLC